MLNRVMRAAVCLLIVGLVHQAAAPQAEAAPPGQPGNWGRFYHYPYVYYPHNLQKPVSYDHLYHRYPKERQIPVMRQDWHNFYSMPHPYHKGHHFTLDVF